MILWLHDGAGWKCRCPHHDNIPYLNVGQEHFFYCTECRAFSSIGSNLFSSWQNESGADWRKNAALIKGFEEANLVSVKNEGPIHDHHH